MIDSHSHLLPGVDDGSPSFEVSIPVIQRFAAEGVTTLVCTPHLNAAQLAAAPYEAHLALIEELRLRASADLRLELGWEIMLDAPNADLSSMDLTLGSSRALLVEFTRGGLPRGATAELRRIARMGRTPVLAHPERYFGCTVDMVREWRAFGVVIQTDASVLMGRGVPARFARQMLELGLIDLLASDNHGDRRSLATAREWLTEQGADEQVELLTRVNASNVLADEEPGPVPPFSKGLLGRLRRMFGAS